MSGFELNKIAGAVVMAGLIAMLTAKLGNWLYDPHGTPDHGAESAQVTRGYAIEVAAVSDANASAAEEEEEKPLDLAALMAAADAEKGKSQSKKCAACHSFDQGGPNKVGPNLWAIMGAPKAANPDFNYSDALKNKDGTWNYEAMFAFLAKPKDYVPGTKMAFAGFRKPEDIADMIAYMRQHDDNPPPLP